ncbi:hypothetical protein KI387_011168, partial [Taxus chinensis]
MRVEPVPRIFPPEAPWCSTSVLPYHDTNAHIAKTTPLPRLAKACLIPRFTLPSSANQNLGITLSSTTKEYTTLVKFNNWHPGHFLHVNQSSSTIHINEARLCGPHPFFRRDVMISGEHVEWSMAGEAPSMVGEAPYIGANLVEGSLRRHIWQRA